MQIIPKGLRFGVGLALVALALWPQGVFSAAPAADFAGWHLPLPAGQWGISRGPCNAGGRYSHDCRYYEESCGVDLTPVTGSMANVPVLAPQAGQVFFIGTRTDAGRTVLVRHADGRVSALMHLAKLAVGLDETVTQGQVLGYAGSTGSSGNPHLHFTVLPNAVDRACVDLQGLDEVQFVQGRAVSRNLAWGQLALPDPPMPLPAWLPTQAISPALAGGALALPARLLLAPGTALTLPVYTAAGVDGLSVNGFAAKPAAIQAEGVLFTLALVAPNRLGEYTQTLQPLRGARVVGPGASLRYTLRLAPDTRPGEGLLWVNPEFVSPANWASLRSAPQLCWSEAASAGEAPFQYRVMVVGTAAADSGWISATCWQPARLGSGRYFWKVFVRDARGYMNRTNQRPLAFTVR